MTRETINQVVGTTQDGGIIVVETLFKHSDSFQGATGAEIYPVSEEMIREAMAEKREYLRELCDDAGIHGAQRQAYMNVPKKDYLEMRYETYQDISREDIAAALGTEVPERYTLTGCGRIFPRALDQEGFTALAGGIVADVIARVREIEGE